VRLRKILSVVAGASVWLAASPVAFGQQMAIAPQFDAVRPFSDGVAPAQLHGAWGLIDPSGSWVVQPTRADMRPGTEGLFPVSENGKWGFIDKSGQMRIPARYEAVAQFEGGAAAAKTGGRWGFLRTDGRTEVAFTFLDIGGRDGRYFTARDDKGWAVFRVDATRKPYRVPLTDDYGDVKIVITEVYGPVDGLVVAKTNRGSTLARLISTSGGGDFYLTGEMEWPEAATPAHGLHFGDGFIPISVPLGKCAYFKDEAEGYVVWVDRFDDCMEFSGGYAPVKINGKWGFIDRAGRLVVEPTYDAAFPLRSGYATVRQGEKRGFLKLDPQNGWIVFVSPQYDDASRFSEGLAAVKVGQSWGFISDGLPRRKLIETGVVQIKPH